MILLGSEVIIMPIDDVRKLVDAFLKPSNVKEQQRLGVFAVLNALRDTVRRYDYEEGH